MDHLRDFLLGPFGGLFAILFKALGGSLCLCGGIQLFNFRDLSSFFTLRKIFGLFLITLGASRVIYIMFFM